MADFLFTVNTANKIIDIDATGDAAASFDLTGTITSGSIGFHISTDGVVFIPVQYYSFSANALKTLISLPSFTGEERGAIDLLGKITLRIVSSPDFQGNVRIAVCEVLDAPTPPEPGTCCPGPTVAKTVKLNPEGKTVLWTPTPGSTFVLLGLQAAVGGVASLSAQGPLAIEVLDSSNPIFSFHPTLPASPATPVNGFEWESDWVVFPGDGFHSSAPNQSLMATLSPPLVNGDVWVTVLGREV